MYIEYERLYIMNQILNIISFKNVLHILHKILNSKYHISKNIYAIFDIEYFFHIVHIYIILSMKY